MVGSSLRAEISPQYPTRPGAVQARALATWPRGRRAPRVLESRAPRGLAVLLLAAAAAIRQHRARGGAAEPDAGSRITQHVVMEVAMPTVHLPTGIDMYYESHGDGEPLVLIPSTAFPADVWLPDQVPALSG